MSASSFLRNHRNTGIGLLVIGGFLAYQLWPRTPVQGREERPLRAERVVPASIPEKRTLHGQFDELKGQFGQLVDNVTGMTKTMQDLKRELADSKEARQLEQAEAKRLASLASHREKELQKEAAAREKLLQDELARERRKHAKADTAPKQGPTGPPAPAKLFELRTIGSSKDRPKNAPSPLVHHVDTAYLPAGCFAKVRLVTGVAATSQLGGSGGASWGHPILYVISEPFECARRLDEIGAAALRRRVRLPLDGCLGFATGKADLASSRVQGEGTLLSCVMPDGEAYEVPMKGYLVGADGTQGLVGEVQTHESAKIGKAFIAGMIEEAAAFFSQARKGVTISVTGQSVPYGGMETTLNKIAAYWLEQARALQPTLFVPSKTEGYLVILQGVPLEGMHIVNWMTTGVL